MMRGAGETEEDEKSVSEQRTEDRAGRSCFTVRRLQVVSDTKPHTDALRDTAVNLNKIFKKLGGQS